VIEQAKILQHDADALAQIGDLVLAELRDVVAEQIDEAPCLGRCDRNNRRSSDVLPAPEGPVRNWKECAGIWKLRSRRISGPKP
jgi:hypothetical protein